MRFLIAGSSGFLGTMLREHLTAQGHEVTPLVRRPPRPDEEQWDPYSAPLAPAVVDRHDVVVNLAGSPNVGNPYSSSFRERLKESRVRTTRVLAEAIAASETRPVLLAQNGISWYGDQGPTPLPETAGSVGDGFMTQVTREWEEATHPAASAGARVVVLRTAPILDARATPLKELRLLFKAGLGGPIGQGTQHMPMISVRDWVAAALHTAVTESVSGPVNLCCERAPTNAEFTRELARQVGRPAFLKVPAPVIRAAMGPLNQLPLDSLNTRPQVLIDSGFDLKDPDVGTVLREGLSHR